MILSLLVFLWLIGFGVFWKLPICRKGSDPISADDVSIIVPARNEERNLEVLLASIRAGGAQPGEIIVVDDGSEDGTAAVARRFGADVITAGELPDGWRGKTWACQQGAAAARGQMLLFLDADTRFMPGGLEMVLNEVRLRGVQALSLGPYHEPRAVYEEMSAVFNLMTFMGLGAFGVGDSVENPKGLFGPFLLIERGAYQSVGGHESVRAEILEHMSLTPTLAARKIRTACLGGRGVVAIRMYPNGLGELVQGWTKAFAAGAARTPAGRMFMVVLWINGSVLSFLLLGLTPWLNLDPLVPIVAYLAFAGQWWYFLRRVGCFSAWTALLFPVALGFFFAIFGRSQFLRLTGRAVVWKGRSIAKI